MPGTAAEPGPPRPPRRPRGAPAAGAADAYRRRPWLSSYPPGVPPAVDVPAVLLPALLDDAAARHPDAVALACLGVETSYGELRRQVDSLAAGLAELGVGRGDRVALVLPDCPQFVLSWFAALRLGAVVVPHDPLTPAPELGRRLGETGATVAVCLDRAYAGLAAARDRTALRHVVVTSLADCLPRRARLALRLPTARARRAREELTAALPEGDRVHRFPDVVRSAGRPPGGSEGSSAGEVALLAWTGDGEGAPAAVVTHSALVANASQVQAWLSPAAAPAVVLAGLPLWQVPALTLCLHLTVLTGGTLVLVPDADPAAVLTAAAERRPGTLVGAPALFRGLVERPALAGPLLSGVGLGVCVGAGLEPAVQERFERLSGGRLVEAYGRAETGLTHMQPVRGSRQPGTVGVPLPGTRAVVLARDEPARHVPVPAPGELAVTGPQLFAGYWRRSEATRAAATPHGHHRTGDLAVMGEDGAFTVLGPPAPAPDTETGVQGPHEPARPRPVTRPGPTAGSPSAGSPRRAASPATSSAASPAASPGPAGSPRPVRTPRPTPSPRPGEVRGPSPARQTTSTPRARPRPVQAPAVDEPGGQPEAARRPSRSPATPTPARPESPTQDSAERGRPARAPSRRSPPQRGRPRPVESERPPDEG